MPRASARKKACGVAVWLVVSAGLIRAAQATREQPVVRFDFTTTQDAQSWQPTHDVAQLRRTPEGLLIEISGDDPYIHGPARDYPTGQPLWLGMRLKSTKSGVGQVFYFTARKPANERDSVRFPVQDGPWQEIHVPLPALGPGHHLRLDPPGRAGDQTVVASLTVEARVLLEEPTWPTPTAPLPKDDALAVRSGDVELAHNADQWGGFLVRVAGQPMAAGLTRPLIGYVQGDEVRWLDVAEHARVQGRQERDASIVEATFRDTGGADWLMRQTFAPADASGALDVTTQVTASQDRNVVFLPMFVVLPGLGSLGTTKDQALFAGLEYLGKDEPSSSEADIVGPGSKRQVPDVLKITIPLMVIQADGRYVGLIWEKQPQFSAVFDSPDRLFNSGAHVMGVLFPGSDGNNRAEGSLLPYDAETLQAGKTLTLRATLIGGEGQSVVPAIQHYVALRGLPPVPKAGVDWDSYAATAAAGWLDSAIRAGSQYRHAYPGGFNLQPAADAALMMHWLALQISDGDLKARLAEAGSAARAEVHPEDLNFAGVSHVRSPAPALVYGHVPENVTHARQAARDLLKRFEPDGSVLYKKPTSGPDYGKTHFAPDANGLTARLVASVLEAASFCGDPELIHESLRVLRALDKFANTVPRGAQTWEIPLHTPDILASANLVRAYTLGYELTGDAQFLEQARYWAWTGVPFVYLDPPTERPVGLYATIPVLGATQWVAPNWMGLPVQWCGLVYADALYRLARHDPGGPWKQLADGITASGVQQTWPRGTNAQRQGLLPDSFALRAELRNDPAINPGTVLANAIRLFDKPVMYDFRTLPRNGLLVHAPGTIGDVTEEAGRVSFRVDAWPEHPCQLLIVGLEAAPRVRINGEQVLPTAPHQFNAEAGWLVLTVEGRSAVEIAF